MVLELFLGKCISQSASLCFKFIKLFKKEYIFHLKIVDQGLKTKYVGDYIPENQIRQVLAEFKVGSSKVPPFTGCVTCTRSL